MRTLLLTVSLSALACVPSRSTTPESANGPLASSTEPARGRELYALHCAVCHGERGRGDGEAARFLFPPPRRFDEARFRLVSSENGAPFEGDLVATMRRGIPGSAMPAWNWLADADLRALAAHVLALAREELERDLRTQAIAAGDARLAGEAASIARARLTPDRPLSTPARAGAGAGAVAAGRAVFLARCAQCHAADGSGEPEPRLDEDGTLNWARDLRAGFLKGGDDGLALTRRIRLGMPGSAMPPTALAAREEADLLAFLRTLIPPGSADQLVHRRTTLRADRTVLAPDEPADPRWESAQAIDVVLAPLWWTDQAVLGAELRALHDGTHLAVRLGWEDETGAIRPFSGAFASDGAALQLSHAAAPPLFGMGRPETPTTLWHWQALREEEVSGALELVLPFPHPQRPTDAVVARPDVPLYRRLVSQLGPSGRVDQMELQGLASVASTPRIAGAVEARAAWSGGRWSVVFRSPLAVDGQTLRARLGEPLQVACAVWNGAAGDGGARKSISIWQELVLAP